MSYSTMNGLNMARTGGLGGTRRMPLPSRPATHPVDPGAQYTPPPSPMGAVGPSRPVTYSSPVNPAASAYSSNARAGIGGTMAPIVNGMNMGVAKRPTGPAPNAVDAAGGNPAPQFDPNDPNNAALVGYMNGA